LPGKRPTVNNRGFAMRGELNRVAEAIPDIKPGGVVRGSVGNAKASLSVARGTAAGRVFFDARIDESNSFAANQWTYEFTEMVPTGGYGGWEVKEGGRTSATLGEAYNRREEGNSASGEQGNGVVLPGSGVIILLKPIKTGLVVLMELRTLPDGTKECWFDSANGIEVICLDNGNGGGE
jgi:hypothetical protein